MKRIIIYICLMNFISVFDSFSQNIVWEKSYGGSELDELHTIKKTDDGGFILGGMSTSANGDVGGNYGGYDYWVVKIDINGDIIWEKKYGGSDDDKLYGIEITDNGYLLAGYSKSLDRDVGSNNGDYDFWVVSIDATGNILWEKNYGDSFNDALFSVDKTNDGGYILGGLKISSNADVSETDFWVVKINALGNVVWERSYGGSSNERIEEIQQAPDGDFVFVGYTTSNDVIVESNNGSFDAWIAKINNQGNFLWNHNLGGSDVDRFFTVEPTSDSGFIAAGFSLSNDGDVGQNKGSADSWVVKFNASGSLQWKKNYGGSEYEHIHSILQTNDGGFIFGGDSESSDGDVNSNNGGDDFWVVKTDVLGNIEWEQNYGGNSRDHIFEIIELDNNNFILAGETESNNGDVSQNNGNSDFWIVKINNIVACRNYAGDIQNQLQELCVGEPAVLTAENVLTTEGSTHGYILHDGELNVFDQIIVEVNQSSSSIGIFEYSENYPQNQQIFMSSITGLLNANGTFNLEEECTSIDLPGVPIIFATVGANCIDENGNASIYDNDCNCILVLDCVPGTACEQGGFYDDNCVCQTNPPVATCQCANGFEILDNVDGVIGSESGVVVVDEMSTIELPQNPSNNQTLIISVANSMAGIIFNQNLIYQSSIYYADLYPAFFFNNDNVIVLVYNEDTSNWMYHENLLDACSCCPGIDIISVNQTQDAIDILLNSDSQIVLTFGQTLVELPVSPSNGQLLLIKSDNSDAELVFNHEFIFGNFNFPANTYAISTFGSENIILLVYDSSSEIWTIREEINATGFNIEACTPPNCTGNNYAGELRLNAEISYGCVDNPLIVVYENATISTGSNQVFFLHNEMRTIFYGFDNDQGTVGSFFYDGSNYPNNEPLYISSVVGEPSDEIVYITNGLGQQTAVSGLPDFNDICTSITLLDTPVTFYGLDCSGECTESNPCSTCVDPAACNTNEEGDCNYVGNSCNDGNADTENDIYNVNCDCEGEPIEVCDIQIFDEPVFNFGYTDICNAIGIDFQMFDFCDESCCADRIDVAGSYAAYIENELVFTKDYTFSNLCGSFSFTNNLSTVQFCNADLFNGAKIHVEVTVSDFNTDCNLLGNLIGTYVSPTKTITENDLINCVQTCYQENYGVCAENCNIDICSGDLEISSNIDGDCNCYAVIEQVPEECNDPTACFYNEDANCVNNDLCEYREPNFDCYGNCEVEIDCMNVCGGSATLDCKGDCNGSAILDCNGDCDGSAIIDCKGDCNGSAVFDCNDDCDGSAIFDCKGDCNGPAIEGADCNDDNPITFDDVYDSNCNCVGREGIFDLALEKELITNGPFNQGEEISIRIKVTNEGEIDANNIYIVNYISEGLALNNPNWTLEDNGNATYMLFGSILSGESQFAIIDFIISDDISGTTILNQTEILSAENELGNDGNDIDSSSDDNPNNDSVNEDDIYQVEIIIEEMVSSNITVLIEKLLDTNCDGLADESADDDWSFSLYDSNNDLIASEMTNENGELSFNGLTDGSTYTINEIAQNDWTSVSPSTGEITITVEANNTYEYTFISSPSDQSGCITYATPDCNCPAVD